MPTFSACAKFILAGEHSIVTKGRAIAFPLPSLRLKVSDFSSITINTQPASQLESRVLLQVLDTLKIKSFPDGLDVSSDIPMGSGLGSSAALCVALLRAEGVNDPSELGSRAIIGESLFHGRSSGIDPFTSAFEKPILFRSNPPQAELLDLTFFKNERLSLVLFDSLRTHETRTLQTKVTKLREELPLIWEELIDRLAANVESILAAMNKSSAKDVARYLNDSQFCLTQLGVSDDGLEDLIESIRRTPGVLAAKITGSGGGGFCVGLVRTDDLPAQAELKSWHPHARFIWSATEI